ncbi:thioredoxin-like [Phascolarctos cinereus]|uniref:Thioredoxin n=1 Tax=Phascolarctos cinereus TaxID=38626 RepID=A0A6P5J577_PHACI|nr:thioredoxin-like [Phascolarctos cinereus]
MVKQIENKENFDSELKEAGEKLVVVNSSATWCKPCKMIKPFFHSFCEEYSGMIFIEVDVDDCQDVATTQDEMKYMPTFQFYKNGQKMSEVSGTNKEKLKSMNSSNCGSC